MKEAEYYRRRKDILKRYDELNALNAEYAHANNPYRVDDVISDGRIMIMIKCIKVVAGSIGVPEMLFSGPVLKKHFEKMVEGGTGAIYQSNIRQGVKSCH